MATINVVPAETLTNQTPVTAANFKGKVDPDWCPGCGEDAEVAAAGAPPRRGGRCEVFGAHH